MTAQLLKTTGWTITAAALFLISLLMPLLVAPMLLIRVSGVRLAGLF